MTETISIYTYVQGFQQFETSYTAAIAFLIIAILTCSSTLRAAAHGDLRDERRRARGASALGAALRARRSSLTVVFLFPVYWLFMISFKTPDEIFRLSAGLVCRDSIQFNNYRGAVQGRRRGHRLEQPGAGRRQHRHRHAPRHASAPTASRASRPAARISRCGSSPSA